MDHYDINTEHSEDVKAEWNYCASLNEAIFEALKEETLERKDVLHFTHADMLP